MATTNDNSLVRKGILRYFYNRLIHNINYLSGKKVDKVDGKGLSTNDFTTAYKNKLDGISEGANKYVLPTASSTILGGIKTGYQTQGKVYPLQVDSSGNGYVSVPWTDNDTTYNVVSTSANGLAPKLPNNASKYLNGQGQWTTPSEYTLPQASSTTLGGVKIGSNITVSSGTISLTKSNVVDALGYTPPTTNTTYSLATTSASGLLRQLNGNTSQFLNGNGQWATPPNTTYGVATTSSNGLMSSTDKSRLDQLWAKFDSMVFFTED